MFLSIEGGKLPLAQTQYSAGYDVFSNENLTIKPKETKMVKLGITLDYNAIAFQLKEKPQMFENLYFGLYLRSSLGRRGLSLSNGVGIIDIDYKNEICMIITNHSKEPFEIKRFDRLGQLIIHKHYGFVYLDNDFRKLEERLGGFGSTNE